MPWSCEKKYWIFFIDKIDLDPLLGQIIWVNGQFACPVLFFHLVDFGNIDVKIVHLFPSPFPLLSDKIGLGKIAPMKTVSLSLLYLIRS